MCVKVCGIAAETLYSHVDGCVMLRLTGSSVCVSHRRHVSSHLKRRGDSRSWAGMHTPLSAGLRQGSRMLVCPCCCAWDRLGKIQHPPNKSNHISSSQTALRGLPPHSVVFASRNRARQNGSTELSFHTVTACCRLLASIKTSQVRAHSCSVYLLQWKPYTAALKQMYTKSK